MLFTCMLAKAFMMLYREFFSVTIFMSKWKHGEIGRVPDDFYADVYDGRVWKSFMGKLLKHKRSLAFMINVDWFQPFKHCTDSLDAIYLIYLEKSGTKGKM